MQYMHFYNFVLKQENFCVTQTAYTNLAVYEFNDYSVDSSSK